MKKCSERHSWLLLSEQTPFAESIYVPSLPRRPSFVSPADAPPRTELAGLLFKHGHLLFAKSAMASAKSEQVDPNWVVTCTLDAVQMALGHTTMPLSHR